MASYQISNEKNNYKRTIIQQLGEKSFICYDVSNVERINQNVFQKWINLNVK